uniref:Uncharacterized protein n=1 Tax=Maylandia zebra TaxID=106582 RepID=A0A3P9B1J0_9CICH
MFYPFLQQKPAPQIAPSPTPAPHILYNPTQHMLTYPNFCPSGQALPAYPNYPVSMQVGAEPTTFCTCYSPDAPSWGRPSALSGSPPATASGSHPGPRRLHADPQRSGALCILLQRL